MLSLFAGAHYSYLGGDLSIFDNGDARLVRLRELLGIRKRLDFSDSTGWVDPVIGSGERRKPPASRIRDAASSEGNP